MNLCVCRILGNELPPRDRPGSKKEVLQFILEKEKLPPTWAPKIWILNQIHDLKYKKEIIKLLEDHNQKYFDFPMGPYQYEQAKYWSDKVRAAININGARNFGLKKSFELGYDFCIMLDGDCFFDEQQINNIVNEMTLDQKENPHRKYYGISSLRVLREREGEFNCEPFSEREFGHIKDFNYYSNNMKRKGKCKFNFEEPMVIFRKDTPRHFNPHMRFGLNDKSELLYDLGYVYEKEKAGKIEGDICKHVGHVYHLAVSNAMLEVDGKARFDSRARSINNLLQKLDEAYK